MKELYFCNQPDNIEKVYGCAERVYTEGEVLAEPSRFSDVEFLFSTWGMPKLTEEQIGACFPKLDTVFYAAGSVRDFAVPFLRRGVTVCSAWAANAIPVAEYAAAQIVLAGKRFFSAISYTGDKQQGKAFRQTVIGNDHGTVGILGAGSIGKRVIGLLWQYDLEIKVFDPFLPEETAAELGVEKVELPELFSSCRVVSNHLANNAETAGMITGELLRSMPYGGTFLNTGRGAQVREEELYAVLRERQDMAAVLDVTDPHSPIAPDAFAALPNCWLTPHIAGSLGDECRRMGELMMEQYRKGKPYDWAVTEEMLKTMA